jgi:DNA repair photolyase
MRWQGQTLDAVDSGALPGLERMPGLVRSVRTPEFAGVTFHEVRCKTALNQVPARSPAPFRWTVNPYRGCTHGCVYCFARATHTYLDLDAGHDFDSQIVVKINIAEVLARELTRPGWSREPVAMGTNTDPYQRAEGRYRLMPGVITALAGRRTPLSILTKGTMISRDLPLLSEAATAVPVQVAISLALLDPKLHAVLEPGTPTPRARLELVRRIRAAGLPCGVLIAPILPLLTDSSDDLERLVTELGAAGATSISGLPLRLMTGAREWFFAWLEREHPELVGVYRQLYAGGANVRSDHGRAIQQRLARVLTGVRLDHHPDAYEMRRPREPTAPVIERPVGEHDRLF